MNINNLGTVPRGTGTILATAAVLTVIALILAFSAVMTASAQSDPPDWKLPVTGLTAVAGDDPGEMLITWDAHTQTTKTFLNYRVAWTPQGEGFKSADQTDWNAHTTGTHHTVTGLDAGASYQVKVRTRYEGNQRSRWTDVMTASAQSDNPDWKLPVTGLTVTTGEDSGELLIAWNHHPQTTKTFLNYRVAWAPQGESFKSADQTDWNVHTTSNQHTVTGLDAGATYKVKIRTRYEGRQGSRWTDVVTGQAGVTPNIPPTGQPTIAGTAEVGETLTAATSAISDSNGLTNAVFNHQWVRISAGSDTDISGATSSAYVITPDDAESKIKVSVSFTDDDGYSETLTSASTASVPANSQNHPRDATDATLSTLSVVSEPGGHTVYLTPAFDPDTSAYTASVANRINVVTLSPTKNESNATVVITGDDDTSTPDTADLDLSVGANALTVTVTAEDASSILTYTVTVTRAAAPPAPTDCPTDTDWCTTLTVGYDTLTGPDAEIEWLGYQSHATYGDLLSTTFSHVGTAYTVSLLYDFKNTPVGTNTPNANSLNLTTNPPLPDGAVLQVGNRIFTVDTDSATTSASPGLEQWDILHDPLNWTEGQHVTTSLRFSGAYDDATLSSLAIEGANNSESITVIPAFDDDTFT